MSLPSLTTATTPTATRIVVSVSLPPATHPMVVGAAGALAAPAALAALAVLGAPTGEVAAFPGTGMTSIGSF